MPDTSPHPSSLILHPSLCPDPPLVFSGQNRTNTTEGTKFLCSQGGPVSYHGGSLVREDALAQATFSPSRELGADPMPAHPSSLIPHSVRGTRESADKTGQAQ